VACSLQNLCENLTLKKAAGGRSDLNGYDAKQTPQCM